MYSVCVFKRLDSTLEGLEMVTVKAEEVGTSKPKELGPVLFLEVDTGTMAAPSDDRESKLPPKETY